MMKWKPVADMHAALCLVLLGGAEISGGHGSRCLRSSTCGGKCLSVVGTHRPINVVWHLIFDKRLKGQSSAGLSGLKWSWFLWFIEASWSILCLIPFIWSIYVGFYGFMSFFMFVFVFICHLLFWSLRVTLLLFFYLFCCLISGSHHSGSPLARGARYCVSADASKVYTIPQASSSGSELGPGPGSGVHGQTQTQSACMFAAAAKTTDGGQGSEGPPNISECGWVSEGTNNNKIGWLPKIIWQIFHQMHDPYKCGIL